MIMGAYCCELVAMTCCMMLLQLYSVQGLLVELPEDQEEKEGAIATCYQPTGE